MITNFICNTVIELIIFICILMWLLGAFTLIIPALWYLGGGDYFYIQPFLDDMRFNKIKKQ